MSKRTAIETLREAIRQARIARDARLETNGRRYRTRVDGTKWSGNSGGFCEYRRYMSMAEGRRLLRLCRLARISELKNEYPLISVREVLDGGE